MIMNITRDFWHLSIGLDLSLSLSKIIKHIEISKLHWRLNSLFDQIDEHKVKFKIDLVYL